MLSPDRISDPPVSAAPPPTTTMVRRAIAFISEQLAHTARDRRHRRSRRRQRHRAASSVPALGRADAEGLPAGAHARPCARAAARIRERARYHLRGRPVGTGAAARSVRHPRGDVAGRMEVGRRRADHPLRLSSLAVRHRAGHGDRARTGRARLRRSGRGAGGARRHAAALAEGELCGGHGAHRAARAPHLRCTNSGARTSRCAWC